MEKIPEYITEMDREEFLEALDDFGDGHYYIHEAARRLRRLQEAVYASEPSVEADGLAEGVCPHINTYKAKCLSCGEQL